MLDGPALRPHRVRLRRRRSSEAGLQHEGDTALALARRLGERRPAGRSTPRTSSTSTPIGSLAVVVPAVLRHAVPGARRGALRRRRGRWRRVGACSRREASPGRSLGSGATLARLALRRRASSWTMYRTAYEQRVWTQHRRRDQRLVPPRASCCSPPRSCWPSTASLLRRLRAWDLAVVALAWWAAGSGRREPRLPGRELPAHVVARRRRPGADRRRPRRPAGERPAGRAPPSPSPAPCPASCS